MRRLVTILVTVLMSSVLFAQNTPTDSQTLRALLDEVRQLRHDLQNTTVAAQRVQIALYRLQLQDAALSRATKVLDDTQARFASVTEERKRFSSEVEHGEEVRDHTQDSLERKAAEQAIAQMKRHLEQLAADQQQWQSKVSDAQNQVQIEQEKVNALRDVIDQLDQTLQNIGRKSENAAIAR